MLSTEIHTHCLYHSCPTQLELDKVKFFDFYHCISNSTYILLYTEGIQQMFVNWIKILGQIF